MEYKKTKRDIYLDLLAAIKTKRIKIYDDKTHKHRAADWNEKEQLIDKYFGDHPVKISVKRKKMLVPILDTTDNVPNLQWEDWFRMHWLSIFRQAAEEMGYDLNVEMPNYCAKIRTEEEKEKHNRKILEMFGEEMPIKSV